MVWRTEKGVDVAKTPSYWTSADREECEERAAIIEYDGKQTRKEAEKMAMEIVDARAKARAARDR